MRVTIGYTEHALERIDKRGLSKSIVEAIIRHPEEVKWGNDKDEHHGYSITFCFSDFRVITNPAQVSDDHIHHSVVTVFVCRPSRTGRRARRKHRLYATASQRKVLRRSAVHA